MAVNSIGSFSFISLEGAVPAYRKVAERISFLGVEGAAYRLHEQESGQFQLTSRVNAADVDAARTLFNNYAATIGTVLALIQNDHEFDDEDQRFIVVDVDLVRVRKIVQWCGTTSDTDKAELVAAWTLETMVVELP